MGFILGFLVKAPRGTRDILPGESYKWEYVIKILEEQAKLFGFVRVRTPVFENEELYVRSSGSDSDVVKKEMYTFLDKSGRSLALRPEGTAGVVRSFLQNGVLVTFPLAVKAYYTETCFRYERPQNCRYREFTQFGVEVFGSDSCLADVEVVLLAISIFNRLGVSDKIVLSINSIGCGECRKNYTSVVRKYFGKKSSYLCSDCIGRLKSNPMRILDCKVESCGEIARGVPSILDYICEECSDKFQRFKDGLDNVGVDYVVDPTVVRGLDYYTGVVFEIVYRSTSGLLLTVCGGGRYDSLLEQLGGDRTPALGFGIGIDRLLFLVEDAKIDIRESCGPDIFFAYIDYNCAAFCLRLVKELTDIGVSAQLDITQSRSLMSQIKYANRKQAKFLAVVGYDEINEGVLSVKNLKTRQSIRLNVDGAFCDNFLNLLGESNKNAEFDRFC